MGGAWGIAVVFWLDASLNDAVSASFDEQRHSLVAKRKAKGLEEGSGLAATAHAAYALTRGHAIWQGRGKGETIALAQRERAAL